MERERLNYLLQNANEERLFALVERIVDSREVNILASPSQQTIMLPVKDPMAGTIFYGGEILVTQALVDVDGVKGWSMIMDKKPELALAVAICDACFEAGIEAEFISEMAEAADERLSTEIEEESVKVASTKVSFDLMSDMSGNM